MAASRLGARTAKVVPGISFLPILSGFVIPIVTEPSGHFSHCREQCNVTNGGRSHAEATTEIGVYTCVGSIVSEPDSARLL